jgi:hypothetical protein
VGGVSISGTRVLCTRRRCQKPGSRTAACTKGGEDGLEHALLTAFLALEACSAFLSIIYR